MKKKKKKWKFKRKVIKLFIFLIIILGGATGYFCFFNNHSMTLKVKNMYLGSTDNSVTLFELKNDVLGVSQSVIRGKKVKVYDEYVTYDDIKYEKIFLDNNYYYVDIDNLVDKEDDIVMEKEKYVRTSVTVYSAVDDYKIESFLKKGSEVNVLGYDAVLEDGSVNKYLINSGEVKGYVYGKYLVNTSEEALMVYNENGTYDIHKDRKYSSRELYGGLASNLDYYPYEKANFDNNSLLDDGRVMYINAGMIGNISEYLNIALDSGVNGIVVDIKDGSLAYPVDASLEYSSTSYNNAINSLEDYKNAIDKIKEAGIYVIGRIVVFNDSQYGSDHPEDCISSTSSTRLWPSAYSRGAWEYNVALAVESVKKFGFNEIQFDYVRFPEDSYNMSVSGNTDFKNLYNEEKAEAVQNFLYYATDQMHEINTYISVDVFGECSSDYVTAYGQYWPAISNIVDVISAMPYTDHFGRSVDTWSNPYQTVYNWALSASTRQKEIPTPAVARTWITAYDTPNWNPTVTYDASMVSTQAQALKDAGLDGGFLTWNGRSSLEKYRQIKSAFNDKYN